MGCNVLDCTFRDGGYYNLWRFKLDKVQSYLYKISESGINFVEIGFRFLGNNKSYYGDLAYCKESYLSKINIPKNITLAVMLNASEIVKLGNDWKKTFNTLFVNQKKSKVKIIRIATHYSEFFLIVEQIKYLKSIGYRIFVNLMQINRISNSNLKFFLNFLNKLKCIEVFYFADSFGCLREKDVKKICKFVKIYWKKSFGIHAHDNCGFALQNTLEALKNGATWVDSTIQGMGRGAGNVKSEVLLNEILYQKIKKIKFKLDPVYHLSQGYFLKLKHKYQWGTSIYYSLAANSSIHPTYIQELLVDNRYSHSQILDAINIIKRNKQSASFNANFLTDLLSNKISKDFWNVKDYFKGKTVLIIGQGNSIKKNKNKILDFIKKNKCIVFCLNINKSFLNKNFYYIVSNESRAIVDQGQYKYAKKFIMPINRLNKILDFNKILKRKIKNYGLIINKKKISVHSSYAELPNSLAIGYALSICKAASVKKVYLVGFDGYKHNQKINIEMKLYFEKLLKYFYELKIESLTKNYYKLPLVNNLLYE